VEFLDFPSIWIKLDSNVTREVLFPWWFYIFIWMTNFAVIGLSNVLKNGRFLPSHLSMLGVKFRHFFWSPDPGYRSNKSYAQSINKTAFWVYSCRLSLILNGRQRSVSQQWVQCFWLAEHTETSQSHCFGTWTAQKTVSIFCFCFLFCLTLFTLHSGQHKIHWCTMAAILVTQFICSVAFKPYWQMGFWAWQRSRRRIRFQLRTLHF